MSRVLCESAILIVNLSDMDHSYIACFDSLLMPAQGAKKLKKVPEPNAPQLRHFETNDGKFPSIGSTKPQGQQACL